MAAPHGLDDGGDAREAAAPASDGRKGAGRSAGRPPLGTRLRRVFGRGRLIALALLAVLVAVRVADPYPVEFLRVKLFDFYQKAQPREVTQRPVTIVDLDEESLSEIGQWPWPRTVLADMVTKLTGMGAAVIGFDIVFAEADRMSPANVAGHLEGLDPATRERLLALPSNDAVFADAIRRSRVVLGHSAFWGEKEDRDAPPIRRTIGLKGPKPHGFLTHVPGLVRNVPVLEEAAAGYGLFTLLPEQDGIVRRVPTLLVHEGDLYPTLAVEMLRVATGRRTILVETNEAGVDNIAIHKALPRIQTDGRGQVWPYFSARDPQKYVSARDVLAGTVDPARIQGHLILVGTSAVGLLDLRATPTEQVMPGVEVHAQLIETALAEAYLSRPNWIVAAELALILVGGALVVWLVPWVGARWTMLLFLLVAAGAAGTSWYLFAEERVLFDAGYGVVALLLTYTLLSYAGHAEEERERRQVRSAFGHYLSPAMVERLASDPGQLRLGGETRHMTMLFCDVRGFTTISEMFDAEGLTRLINKLLTPLTEVILRRQGTVDKYMGDCIMAFWNAPIDDDRHQRNACLAALEMNAAMGPINERLAAEAEEEGRDHVPLKVGIGVNSGDVVVGNMGSDQRFDYSVLGDNVNLASRLEGQSKTYGVDIVVGENTFAGVGDLAGLELDLIRVKGKTSAVRIFTVLGDEAVARDDGFQALRQAHDAMLDAYRGQRWDEARRQLAACREKADGFNLSGLYDLYEERIAAFEASPPGPDWDGVFVATSK